MKIGEFSLKNKEIVTAVVRIGETKKAYKIETLLKDKSKPLASKEIEYNEFFTVSGVFLSYKFKKILDEVIEET